MSTNKGIRLNTFDLETLLQRGMELLVWYVPADNPLFRKNKGMFGAKVYDPDEINPGQLEMWEYQYAPTVEEAIAKAVKEER